MATMELYDTTLRDGTQMEGITFSLEDKLKIAQKLDELGIHYIEGGYPGSNPKDAEFFVQAKQLPLRQATIVAFGSTRRADIRPEDDANLQALLGADTRVVTIVAKSSDLHVTEVLRTSLEENLAMISDSVRFLKSKGRAVFVDAEHYFDGYKRNPSYTIACLKAAAEAGADRIIPCDTNGGSLPEEVAKAIRAAVEAVNVPIGIHTHNDCELAVANTLAGVAAGATQVQGTINGYGERCGNANLCSIIPALKLKAGLDVVTDEQLASLTEVSRYVHELANLNPNPHAPFVGGSAFAHKAGLHADAVMKNEDSYQHIDPSLVGNKPRFLVSELAGRASVVNKARELGIDLDLKGPIARAVLEKVKDMESRGFQYELAEASFELLVRRAQPGYCAPFELVDFFVMVEKHRRPSAKEAAEEMLSEATVKVRIGEAVMHTAAEGNGPVNALDAALRKALVQFYPGLAGVKLVDYKVRILDEAAGTEAQVRVLIESTDGERRWRTVGSSTNIIEASWLALADAMEFRLAAR